MKLDPHHEKNIKKQKTAGIPNLLASATEIEDKNRRVFGRYKMIIWPETCHKIPWNLWDPQKNQMILIS